MSSAPQESGGEKQSTRATSRVGAQATQRAILDAARTEFAEKGFAGTRTDAIARLASTNKQALFYHFGSKEGLYSAVIEDCYTELFAWVGERSSSFDIQSLPPEEGLRCLVETFFDSMVAFPQVLEIIADENKYKGIHLRKHASIREATSPFVTDLKLVLKRGVDEGVFDPRLDPIQVWLSIVSLCQFWWDHRYTLSHILDHGIAVEDFIAQRRKHVIDFILTALMYSKRW